MHRLSIALLASAVVARVASAEPSAAAEQLFRDGVRQAKAGDAAGACTAFEASERLEHRVSTLLNLADCREKLQQLATAWALFLRAASEDRREGGAFHASATRRAARIEPRLSYLTINIPDGSRVSDLVVLRDGVIIDRGEWNVAVPIDGGRHEITGKAPGHESWSTAVTVAPSGDRKAVEVPRFKELPALVARLAAPVPAADAAPTVVAAVAVPAVSPWTPRRRLALGIAIGGGALVAGGAGFALSARGLRDDARASCPPATCSVDAARSANATHDRARGRALLANVGFAAGGAAVLASAVLWLTGRPAAPDETDDGLALAPLLGDAAGLAVGGAW